MVHSTSYCTVRTDQFILLSASVLSTMLLERLANNMRSRCHTAHIQLVNHKVVMGNINNPPLPNDHLLSLLFDSAYQLQKMLGSPPSSMLSPLPYSLKALLSCYCDNFCPGLLRKLLHSWQLTQAGYHTAAVHLHCCLQKLQS